MPGALAYEDFRVGQRFDSGRRAITEADLRRFVELSGDAGAIHVDPDHARAVGADGPVVHGPFAIAVVLGLLFDQRIVEPTALAMLDLDWRFIAPVVAGDELRFGMTITRCRRSRSRQAGVVGRHFQVLNQDDGLVQEGTSALLVEARADAGGLDPSVRTDFGSPAWAQLLLPHLAASHAFLDSTASFDGAIGLQAGREAVQLRVYRGAVLEAARTTPRGATFTIAGGELAWTRLALGERNDFLALATLGEFSATGDLFEYLRMTKAVVAIWDAVRALAAGRDPA